MKRKNMKENGQGQAAQCIRMSSLPHCQVVAIAGTFNNWKPDATRMIAIGEGYWRKELVLPPGDHEYLLVATGNEVPDPAPKKNCPRIFGRNSGLRVFPKNRN